MKALYSRKELDHLSFEEMLVPFERYFFKFQNQREEISKLKFHEKDFLFRAMRCFYDASGEQKYNVYKVPELKECLFFWIILLHSNSTMVFDCFVPGPGNIPLTVKEKRRNKRFFYEYLQVWKSQIEKGRGAYMSIIKPAIHEKLKDWQVYARGVGMPSVVLKQKELFIYACFFHIYYYVKLYFDELPQPYILKRINGIDVVFNVFSYVHIYSRHYIPNMNLDLGTVSLNPDTGVIDLDELPDSIFNLLNRYNESFPIKHETQYCLFTWNDSSFILWLKDKILNETKNAGLEVRSFYKCTEKRDIDKFYCGDSIPLIDSIINHKTEIVKS